MAFFTSVGLSIFDTLKDSDRFTMQCPVIAELLSRMNLGEWKDKLETLCTTGAPIPRAHLERIQPGHQDWNPAVCAEWDSMAAFNKISLSEHKVVLLTTDTAEGVAAGLTIGALLGGRVSLYEGNPNNQTMNGEGVTFQHARNLHVDVRRVPGLFPGEQLGEGLSNYTELVARISETYSFKNIWVCLSGGVKTHIPAMVTGCEYLRSSGKISGAFLKHITNPGEPNEVRLRPVSLSQDLEDFRKVPSVPSWTEFAGTESQPNEIGRLLKTLERLQPATSRAHLA